MHKTTELRQRWYEAELTFFQLLDGLGATEEASTITTRLLPQRITSEASFLDHLESMIDPGEKWLYMTVNVNDKPGDRWAIATPVSVQSHNNRS